MLCEGDCAKDIINQLWEAGLRPDSEEEGGEELKGNTSEDCQSERERQGVRHTCIAGVPLLHGPLWDIETTMSVVRDDDGDGDVQPKRRRRAVDNGDTCGDEELVTYDADVQQPGCNNGVKLKPNEAT